MARNTAVSCTAGFLVWQSRKVTTCLRLHTDAALTASKSVHHPTLTLSSVPAAAACCRGARTMQMMPRHRLNSDPETDTAVASGCRACCSWAAFQPLPGAEGPLQHRARLQAGTQASCARCVFVCMYACTSSRERHCLIPGMFGACS